MKPKTWKATTSLAVAVVVLVIGVLGFLRFRDYARRQNGRGVLWSLGAVISVYARDNGGAFPPSMATLVKQNYGSPRFFTCPGNPKVAGSTDGVDKWMDYIRSDRQRLTSQHCSVMLL